MMNRLLDLRFVIGLFFLITGILLLLYSFFSAGLAETVNRWCGIVFIAFGIFMAFVVNKIGTKKEAIPEDTLE